MEIYIKHSGTERALHKKALGFSSMKRGEPEATDPADRCIWEGADASLYTRQVVS